MIMVGIFNRLSSIVDDLPRVLSIGPPLKIFIDYDKTFLGAAPPIATRGSEVMR